ncbi:MAG: hypothetical protein ACHQQQ_00200 [Bacteroidota bacterium]
MYYHIRSQFSNEDYEFVSTTLGTTSSAQKAIVSLSYDQTSLTEMLHDRRIFERLLKTPPLFLTVSPHFFFYVFAYNALSAKGLANDDLADYIAGICIEFSTTEHLWQGASVEGGMIYIVDLMNLMNDLDRPHQYYLRLYIGNAALFLTGFYPDFLYRRTISKGAPPIAYYESVGREQFGSAALQVPEAESDLTPILYTLAERFVIVRTAINLYTDAYLNLSNTKYSLGKIQRQAETLDDESFKQSLGM